VPASILPPGGTPTNSMVLYVSWQDTDGGAETNCVNLSNSSKLGNLVGLCRKSGRSGRRHRVRAGPPAAGFAHNGVMRRVRVVWQFLRAAAVCLLIVAFSLLIVVAGESLRRYVLAGPAAHPAQPRWHRVPRHPGPGTRAARRAPSPPRSVRRYWRRRRFLMLLIKNPLYIALTAPARWLLDRAGGLGRGPWRGRRPPAAGVREPRRPKPGPPSGAVALAEPRTEPVIARLLGTVSGRPRRPDNREGPGSQSRGRRASGRWRRRTP